LMSTGPATLPLMFRRLRWIWAWSRGRWRHGRAPTSGGRAGCARSPTRERGRTPASLPIPLLNGWIPDFQGLNPIWNRSGTISAPVERQHVGT